MGDEDCRKRMAVSREQVVESLQVLVMLLAG